MRETNPLDATIITDGRILRELTRAGFIEWKPGTDRHWTGHTIKRVWVREGPKLAHWYDEFTYHGRPYRLHYIDGCFHPFVCRADRPVPSFV